MSLLDYIEELNEKVNTSAQQYEQDSHKMHETLVKAQSNLRETQHELEVYVRHKFGNWVENKRN